MTPVLLLLGILILGFVSTNLIFTKLKFKFYVPSGIEYIFVGVLINPALSNFLNTQFGIGIPQLLDNEIIIQLSPGISAAIGIIGLVYGMKFKFSEFQKSVPEHLRLAFFEILSGLIIIGGVSFGVLYFLFSDGNNFYEILAASLTLGVAGGISSNFVIKNLIDRYKIFGVVSDALNKSSAMNLNFSILLYGLIFGIIHVGANQQFEITPTEWVVIGLSLSIIIGLLFFIFLGKEEDENKLFVAVLGITIFTSGTAYFLNFSPLYMNFILGIILGNLFSNSEKLETSLSRLLHPLAILVAVMAGFLWMPPNLMIFSISVFVYIFIRYISKKFAGYLTYISAYDKSKLDSKISLGLLPQDIIATAMIIDYMNVYQNEFTPIVVSAVLASVILYSFLSFSTTKNFLVDVTEITGEIE